MVLVFSELQWTRAAHYYVTTAVRRTKHRLTVLYPDGADCLLRVVVSQLV